VLGYLLAGVVIGPQALGLIRDTESVAHISELGVVLLLFIIGLELSPKRLWLMRKAVFGVGTAQVLLTGAVIGAIACSASARRCRLPSCSAWAGAVVHRPWPAEPGRAQAAQCPHGRLAFAILLFQDIAAIPLIALVPLLAAAMARTPATATACSMA
jgi:glutathione-regulated potassium-efflux system protein KefB